MIDDVLSRVDVLREFLLSLWRNDMLLGSDEYGAEDMMGE